MAATGKKKGIVAFVAGIVAAPLVGVAAVAFTVGIALIWYAGREPSPASDEVAFGFAEPDDIEAREVPAEPRPRPSQRRRARPSSRPSPRPAATAPPSPREASDPPSDDEPSPTPSEPGSVRPSPTGGDNGEVVDIRELEAPSDDDRGQPGSASSEGPEEPSPMEPPDVARVRPEPQVRTRAAPETGPHEYPDNDEPSWIPDTFRSVVESGIAMLTGEEADEDAGTPAMPDERTATRTAPSRPDGDEAAATPSAPSEDGTADAAASRSPAPRSAPSPQPEDANGGTSSDTAAPRSPAANPIPELERTGPEPGVVPESSALPTTEPDDAMPFAPAPRQPAPSGESSTFDDLVSGGLEMVTGQGAPSVEPVPSKTRTRTDMEQDVAEYTDPAEAGASLELSDDLSIDVEEHDAADSFGTASNPDVDITAPVPLDELVIPVRIETATPGVTVKVDGESLGVSPARRDLSDDDHTVVLGTGAQATTFTIAPMANPDVWCFDTKASGGYRQVPCD